MTHAQRVRKGATLLDSIYPGWADKVDLSTFDISSGCQCVLGQLYGAYGLGMSFLIGSGYLPRHYDFHGYSQLMTSVGFYHAIPPVIDTDTFLAHSSAVDADYQALQKAWIPEIARRQTFLQETVKVANRREKVLA